MIEGSVTTLRAIEEQDLETLRLWRNQPHFRRFFREHREISTTMQRRWFESIVLNDPRTRMFSIVEKSNGRLLGACGLCWIDWINRSADFSLYIGADDVYIDEVFAPDAGKLLMDFGFAQLGLHRIWAEIYHTDAAKIALFPTLGLIPEGRHRHTAWKDGQWVDSLFFARLAS
jgi:RimJ/RimL family protein N-acetyltransferase